MSFCRPENAAAKASVVCRGWVVVMGCFALANGTCDWGLSVSVAHPQPLDQHFGFGLVILFAQYRGTPKAQLSAYRCKRMHGYDQAALPVELLACSVVRRRQSSWARACVRQRPSPAARGTCPTWHPKLAGTCCSAHAQSGRLPPSAD